MIKISGCNFFTTDVNDSIQIYHSIFEWEIGVNSPNHGELILFSMPKICLYFDNSNGKCPSQAGSITIHLNLDLNKNSEPKGAEFYLSTLLNSEMKRKIWNENFTREYEDFNYRYAAWLDPWKNRIWLDFSTRA